MSDDSPEHRYPVRSLHDFLSELDKEWDRFRTGSLIGMIISSALLVIIGLRLLAALARAGLIDFLFMLIIAIFLAYTVSALLAQHRFFKRWERRIGLLLHLENSLFEKTLEEKTQT